MMRAAVLRVAGGVVGVGGVAACCFENTPHPQTCHIVSKNGVKARGCQGDADTEASVQCGTPSSLSSPDQIANTSLLHRVMMAAVRRVIPVAAAESKHDNSANTGSVAYDPPFIPWDSSWDGRDGREGQGTGTRRLVSV
jgi:hypothetical protein